MVKIHKDEPWVGRSQSQAEVGRVATPPSAIQHVHVLAARRKEFGQGAEAQYVSRTSDDPKPDHSCALDSYRRKPSAKASNNCGRGCGSGRCNSGGGDLGCLWDFGLFRSTSPARYPKNIYIYISMIHTYGRVPLPPGPPRPPGGSGPPRPPHAGAAGLIAGLLSTVPAGVLLGSMLGPAPSNAEAADESNTSAAAAEPVGPQAIDGEWVFMPSSMRLLLEHFDFELSKAENEDQIEGGSARLRLSRCMIDESDVHRSDHII